jgi:hypothetical protein
MDIEPQRHPGGGDDLERSSILCDRRQRRILATLLDHPRPMTVRELSVYLVARAEGVDPSTVTESECQSVQMDLRHRCLPKLHVVGWIEQRGDGVTASESPAVETAALSFPELRDPDDPFWDVVGVLLARPYRQDLVSILANRDQPASVTELATELLAQARAPVPDDGQRLAIALHHLDLPKLASTGVVEYDPDDRTAVRTSRLLQFVDWVDLDA